MNVGGISHGKGESFPTLKKFFFTIGLKGRWHLGWVEGTLSHHGKVTFRPLDQIESTIL